MASSRRRGARALQALRPRMDAQRWLDEITANVVTGTYVDLGAGKVIMKKFATHWQATQVGRDGTVRLHLTPASDSVRWPAFGAPTSEVRQAVVRLTRPGDSPERVGRAQPGSGRGSG